MKIYYLSAEQKLTVKHLLTMDDIKDEGKEAAHLLEQRREELKENYTEYGLELHERMLRKKMAMDALTYPELVLPGLKYALMQRTLRFLNFTINHLISKRYEGQQELALIKRLLKEY